MLDKNHKRDGILEYGDSLFQLTSLLKPNLSEHTIPFKSKKPSIGDYTNTVPGSFKTFF